MWKMQLNSINEALIPNRKFYEEIYNQVDLKLNLGINNWFVIILYKGIEDHVANELGIIRDDEDEAA